MRHHLLVLVLSLFVTASALSQSTQNVSNSLSASVSWTHYFVQNNMKPKRVTEQTCYESTVTFYVNPAEDVRNEVNEICNPVVYLNDSLYKLEPTSEELDQTRSIFLFKPQGRSKFLVQVGNQIYTVYCERHCMCPDPMCEAKHGHMQMCSTRYFTKEFGTLFSSDERRSRLLNDFYILEAENPSSDINALVYHILSKRIFTLQPDHPMLQLYLNR